MSPAGQLVPPLHDDDLESPRTLVAFAYDYPRGYHIAQHRHRRHQLLYAIAGSMTVTAERGNWLVPPQFAVWIPAGTVHAIVMPEAVGMRSLYVSPDARPELPTDCGVRHVTRLMRELILRVMRLPGDYDEAGPDGRLVEVALDEIGRLAPAPLHLPWPADRRIARIAAAIQAAPDDNRTLADWAHSTGASERTLARLFVRETGFGFGAWRRRARLVHAVHRLAMGAGVTETALECGYDSVSAFVAAFRRDLGVSPGRYAARLRGMP